MKFNCQVISIKDAAGGVVKGDNKGYFVQCQLADGQVTKKYYDVVAVCSGLHNIPYIPRLFACSETKGGFVNKFKGKIIHSSEYKDSSIFAEKRILVLGCGETAMDIAHRAVLAPSSKSVALSVRRGFLSIPHSLAKDRPLDVFITNLFEHAYEHPWVHALRLRWHLSTIFIRIFLLITGSSHGFNQWAAHTTPVRRGYHIINKSSAAMRHLNVPIKQMSLMGRFWLWVYGESHLRPIYTFHRTQVVDVEDDGVTVRFCDGRTYKSDLIVLATGYKQSFPFLDRKIQQDFQQENLQKKGSIMSSQYDIDEDYLPAEHFIVGKCRPRLGFIGFVRPNVGAIPPMSEVQVS
jgi:dimethylaniline monooxygenase (N-oxide forming)